MKRIGILTAGGDTPALNAAIHGAVVRANQLRIEIYGLIKGFNCLFNPRVPHVHLNPLFQAIPELDPTKGGTLIGSSRDYIDPDRKDDLDRITRRLEKLGIEGLIAIGGDGTLNALQPLAERLPTVLAPKTIDNDLGLNYPSEPDEWMRVKDPTSQQGYVYKQNPSGATFDLNHIVNYATPGYATAVLVTAQGVERIRTTAESHRRIAIIEVMGRHSGYIALGTAYGQPDIILVPEHPLNTALLVERVKHLYDLQKNVVIVCGEGIVDEDGTELGAESTSTDPGGNVALSGAAEALRDEDDSAAGRSLLSAVSPRELGQGGDLHQEGRAHAARRPADPVRPVLRGAARLEGRRSPGGRAEQRRLHPPVPLAEGLSRRGLRREPVPGSLGPHPRAPDAPGAVRSAC